MSDIWRARRSLSAVVLVAVAAMAFAAAPAAPRAQAIPDRIADATFWRMIEEMSEPDGYFRSDNFASNETSFQYVIPELNRIASPGGVYLGVGPDQNFTYISALKPKIAFILDIRRQNMLLHLMYKGIMELSPDRVMFASRLFCRTQPRGVDSTWSADSIINAVYLSPQSSGLYQENFQALRNHLTGTHGFALSPNDLALLHYVYSTFCSVGPGIKYQGGNGGPPTWWDLQVSKDGFETQRAYLATEANYRVVREMQEKNLIVPVVGDFGGPKALRAIGRYLAENQARVTAFYLSNVEQYLFQSDSWLYFYRSVATLPLDSSSTFIRSVFNNQGGVRLSSFGTGGGAVASLLASMTEQVRMFNEGRLTSYAQVIASSR
jgi:hypothetical protein